MSDLLREYKIFMKKMFMEAPSLVIDRFKLQLHPFNRIQAFWNVIRTKLLYLIPSSPTETTSK